MKGVVLKLYLIFLPVLSFSFVVRAQDLRFIYIQAESQKPFYIKMNESSIASSPSGYIIIPRLTGGVYHITVGFPKSFTPEITFIADVKETDAGYLIKSDVDQGNYVVDLATMESVTFDRHPPAVKSREMISHKDEFARILAEVVNDSTINETRVFTKPAAVVVKTEIAKVQSVVPVLKTDSTVNSKPVIKPDNKTTVLKIDQKNTDEGLIATYLDDGDTIPVFMPAGRVDAAVKPQRIDPLVVSKQEKDSLKGIRFIEMELQNPNQRQDSATIQKDDFVIREKKNAAHMGNIQPDSIANIAAKESVKCKNTATENDFLQLRKTMAAEKTEADMQKLAVNEFRSICYNTEQIKNLGVLFITEEERYKFYVAAYPYVLDVANFGKLENQLADSYYITRFKAMLNH